MCWISIHTQAWNSMERHSQVCMYVHMYIFGDTFMYAAFVCMQIVDWHCHVYADPFIYRGCLWFFFAGGAHVYTPLSRPLLHPAPLFLPSLSSLFILLLCPSWLKIPCVASGKNSSWQFVVVLHTLTEVIMNNVEVRTRAMLVLINCCTARMI